jgi:hypothetical protein
MPILQILKYIIYLKKKTYKHNNNNNNDKLRPDRLGTNRLGPERLEISGKRGVVLMLGGWTGAHAVDVVAKRLKTRLY